MANENDGFCVSITDTNGRLLFSSEAVESFYIGRLEDLLHKNLLPITEHLFSLDLGNNVCVIKYNRQLFISPLALCHIEIYC